jgi:hypothetical protein
MTVTVDTARKVVYWHLDLPPLSADVCGDDTIEATSHRVPASLSHRDDAWDRCYKDLMDQARVTLEQEVARRGGDYAHVKDELIDTRHNEAKGEIWLYGRFRYVMYREPTTAPIAPSCTNSVV